MRMNAYSFPDMKSFYIITLKMSILFLFFCRNIKKVSGLFIFKIKFNFKKRPKNQMTLQ